MVAGHRTGFAMKPSVQAAFVTLGLLASAQALGAQDLRIAVTQHFGSLPRGRETQSTEVRYIKDQRTRIEWRNSVGYARRPNDPPRQMYGPPMATIYQCDQRRVLTLNLRDREYSSHEVDEHGLLAGAMAQSFPVERTGINVVVRKETVDTGERREMFGHSARRIITRTTVVAPLGACARSGESETDGWYIDVPVPPDRCTSLVRTKGSFAFLSANCRGKVDEYDFQISGETAPGFPLYLKMTSGGETPLPDGVSMPFETVHVTEVLEFSEAPLDPALFEVPKGYKLVAEVRGDPPVPFSSRVYTWWQRVKGFFASLFS